MHLVKKRKKRKQKKEKKRKKIQVLPTGCSLLVASTGSASSARGSFSPARLVATEAA
jgi:hypothetical protein